MADPTPTPAPPTPGAAPPAPAAPDLVSLIPEDLRSSPALAPHFSPEGTFDLPGALKSYISAQSLIGGERIPVPKPDAPRDQWEAFFNRLGRPDKSDGYQLQKPNGYARDIDEKLVGDYKGAAHAAGLSASQTQALYEWFLKQQDGTLSALESGLTQSRETSMATLKKEFGGALDEKLTRGRSVMQKFGDDELANLLDNPEIGNHPALIRFAIKLGEALSEDSLAPGIRGPSRFGLTPDAARSEIVSLMADPAYLNAQDPRHADVVKKIGELSEAAWQPNGSVRGR